MDRRRGAAAGHHLGIQLPGIAAPGYAGLRRGVRLSSDGGKQKLSTGTVMETVLSVAGLGTTLLLAAVLH